MKLIEQIQVRSFSENDKQQAIDTFNTLSLKEDKIPYRLRLLRNLALPTDLVICLYWDTVETPPFKSAFGEKLAAAFKYFGWISHSVWEPIKEKI